MSDNYRADQRHVDQSDQRVTWIAEYRERHPETPATPFGAVHPTNTAQVSPMRKLAVMIGLGLLGWAPIVAVAMLIGLKL